MMMPDFMQPLTPEQFAERQQQAQEAARQQRELDIRQCELDIRFRRMELANSWLYCTCEIPYAGGPEHEACPVHNRIMFHYRTGEVVTWP